jgi:hypothetical protein
MLHVIPLSRPLPLFEGYSPTEIKRADIPRLRDTRVLGWDGQPLPLPLEGIRGEKCEVHTINELHRRTGEGYFAATTRDMRVQGNYYELAKTILLACQLASNADTSFIDDPYVSVGSIEFMPADLLHILDRLSEDGVKGPPDKRTIAQLLAAGECSVSQNDVTALAVEKDVRTFSMEVLRADLNGDDVKDILVHQAFQVVGGSMSWSGSLILTRQSADGAFERVPLTLG